MATVNTITPEQAAEMTAHYRMQDDCATCGEGVAEVCPKSKRACGHHCNHVWTHDACDWCGAGFGEEGNTIERQAP